MPYSMLQRFWIVLHDGNEVTTLAKLRYQAELAPDFSLMDWLKNDELAFHAIYDFCFL